MISRTSKAAGQQPLDNYSTASFNQVSFTKPFYATITEIAPENTEPQLQEHQDLYNIQYHSRQRWWRWCIPFARSTDYDLLKGWKPATIQGPILGGFIITSLSIIIFLEVLSRISLRPENGSGLAFAADVNSLSVGTTFGYSYLPTILAVCYSLMWSWVDLDVKRLEPWFQLSRKEGASASSSLLLEYPFDFLPFVPITAFRRKHWGVFFAGVIMLMVFWMITPLQSAIFSTGTVTRHILTYMGTNAAEGSRLHF